MPIRDQNGITRSSVTYSIGQSWCYWHFGLNNSLLRKAVLCFINVSAASWPLTTRCQEHVSWLTTTKDVCLQTSANVPWGAKSFLVDTYWYKQAYSVCLPNNSNRRWINPWIPKVLELANLLYKTPSPHLENITKRSKMKRKTNNTWAKIFTRDRTQHSDPKHRLGARGLTFRTHQLSLTNCVTHQLCDLEQMT